MPELREVQLRRHEWGGQMVVGDGCDHHAERQLTYHHQGTHLLVSTVSICGWCEQWLVLLARELDLVLFCLSGALSASPCVFRIDASTQVEHDSDFTPSAKVDRHVLPQLGCVEMANVQSSADRLVTATAPADTRKRKRDGDEDDVECLNS